MLFDDEKLNALILRIYDAALDDALWPSVIHQLARLVNANDSALFSPHLSDRSQPFILSPYEHADIEVWNYYASYFWQHDVWAKETAKQGLLKSGTIIHGDQFIERRAFRQTEIYCDLFKPKQDGIEVIMGAVLLDEATPEQSPPIFLSLYRTSFAEAFTRQDEYLIRQLMPHFQSAFRIRRKMAEEQQIRLLREEALNQNKDAIILLDATGRILFANRKAELLLRRGNPTVKQGRLCSPVAYENRALGLALRNAQAGIGSTLKFDNAPLGTRIATFSPLSEATGEQWHTPTRILVMITEPEQPVTGDLGAFAKLYGLTAAETRVLEQLLQQHGTQEIAAALHIGITTLRTHLRALFAKTQTKNQRELIKFCLSHPMIGE